MMEGVWEIGILLIGIGILFACVYLGLLLKQAADTMKKIDYIVLRNEREIEDILYSARNLLETADDVSYSLSNFSLISTILGLNKMRKSKGRRRRR